MGLDAKRALLLTPLLLLTGGCLGLPGTGGANDSKGRGEWYTSGGDSRHSCRVSQTGPLVDVVSWKVDGGWLGGTNWHEPVIADNGTVYYSTSSALVAVSPAGRRLWSTLDAGCEQTSLSLAEDGTIYLGDGDGHLCAYSPTGHLRWQCYVGRRTGSYHYTGCTALAADGTVYLAGEDLCAVSPDGQLQWRFTMSETAEGAPAVAPDGAIVLASWRDGVLYCVAPDGTERWHAQLAENQRASPSVGEGGTVYIGTSDGKLDAFSPDGKLEWSCQTTGSIESAPAVGSDGTIYLTVARGTLYAVSADGQVVWHEQVLPVKAEVMMTSIALDAEDKLYFGTLGRDMDFAYAYYPSGQQCWKHQMDDALVGAPAIGNDGSVYFKSMGGNLYAFGSGG